MSRETQALAVARAYHRAWTARQLEAAGSCSVDMTSNVEMLAEFGNDEDALLLYDMSLPFGTLRVAEHFRISGNRITRIRQIDDTADIHAAMAARDEERCGCG